MTKLFTIAALALLAVPAPAQALTENETGQAITEAFVEWASEGCTPWFEVNTAFPGFVATSKAVSTSANGFADEKKKSKDLLDYSAGQSGVMNVCGYLFRNALGPYSKTGNVWIKKGVWIMRRT